jgi:uncharacterized LabA/DUF88 family protein
MTKEPKEKKVIIFIDGQNLFHTVKESFGYDYPNYNIKLLSEKICEQEGWEVKEIYFYTGVPDLQDNQRWHIFWNNKLSSMGQKGIQIFRRSLKYRNQLIKFEDGTTKSALIGQEKGVDVRIAIDIVKYALGKRYDVALIFSQDQDLSEVADEVREIGKLQNRWIKIASAFPTSPTAKNKRGINNTDWIKFDRKMYDLCIDPKDYR